MGDKRTTKRTKPTSVRQMLRADGPGTLGPRPSAKDDLYGEGYTGNLMKGKYAERADIQELIQKRHAQGIGWIGEDGVWRRNGHEWPVPYGVREALHTRLNQNQLVNKYPWYATWRSPKDNRRLKKRFQSLPAAIDFVSSKAQYVDPQASVISRHGFYIPIKLMGKFPRKGKTGKLYYWCPCCMQPRTFRRNGQEFFAMKKIWSEDKARYLWKDLRLAVLCCSFCGISNRDNKFRASNQPLEKRRFKKGVRRARRKR